MAADPALVAAVTERLAAAADPGRAPQMQAYMKSDMPYLGVAVPSVRAVTKAAARDHPPASVDQLAATAAALWRAATYREHRYAATALTGLRLAEGSLTLLPLYEEMIVTGAWWDHVDAVAPRLGQLLVTHPAKLRPLLLTRVIDANIADQGFFVRKAIGWALRDYARTDPQWVTQFVAARAGALSTLSRREATRHLI